MVNKHLQNMAPNLVDRLPSGAVTDIAKKHGITRQTASLWLKGGGVDMSKVIPVVKSAIEVLESYSSEQMNVSYELKDILAEEQVAEG